MSGTCSNCGAKTDDLAVLSPTVDPKKREMCMKCARSMWQEEILLPSEVWHIMFMFKNKSMVYDPDGWDRKNWEKSWGEKISWKEFNRRAMMSTLCPADDEIVAKALWVLYDGIKEDSI